MGLASEWDSEGRNALVIASRGQTDAVVVLVVLSLFCTNEAIKLGNGAIRIVAIA